MAEENENIAIHYRWNID